MNSPPPEKRLRVLVVDDDENARTLMNAVLGDDFDVALATAAAEAEGMLHAEPFDVVVCDHAMPGELGLKFLGRLSEIQPTCVGILVTGNGELEEVRAEMRKPGATHVMLKPFDPDRLARWVAAAGAAARARLAAIPRAARLDE